MSPINPTQQGIIDQRQFTRLLILGCSGKLEVSRPPTDDERHDLEIHTGAQFPQRLSFQVN